MNTLKHLTLASTILLPLLGHADPTYQGLSPSGQTVVIPSPNKQMLSNPFSVYSNGKIVINHPAPGFNQINIPVDNSFSQNPGCYIMCYSHQKGLYSVGNNIYAQGMIRLSGIYDQKGVCQPSGYENQDISAMEKFKTLCNQHIKTCQGGCWAGGATGGWYGMQ